MDLLKKIGNNSTAVSILVGALMISFVGYSCFSEIKKYNDQTNESLCRAVAPVATLHTLGAIELCELTSANENDCFKKYVKILDIVMTSKGCSPMESHLSALYQ